MTRLTPVTHGQLVGGLRRCGFSGPHPGGKHLYMLKGKLRLIIPNPHHGDISSELLARILRQAAIDRNEWLCE